MKTEDEGIRPVREVRAKISAEFGNDPLRLIDHYLAEQERYRDRLLPPIPAQQQEAIDDPSHRG